MRFTEESSRWGAEPAETVRRRVSRDDLLALLEQDAEGAAADLLGKPNERLSKRTVLRWGTKGSARMALAGPYKNRIADASDDNKPRDLIAFAARHFGSKDAAYEWARGRVGDTGHDSLPLLPSCNRAAENAKQKAGAESHDAERRAKSQWAEREWNAAEPMTGTHAERYLIARCVRVPEGCTALRFHRSQTDGDKKRFPAMMAALTLPDGTFCAAQATFLDRDGAPRKAAGAHPNKKNLGSPGAGAVWLTQSRDRMLIGEGVETVLAGWTADQALGAVAVLSTANYANAALPPELREIIVLVDVDDPNSRTGKRPGEAAARQAAEKWTREGRKVWLAFPGPRDGPKCDFNDLLRSRGVNAVRAALAAAEPFVSEADAAAREKVLAHGGKLVEDASKLPLPRGVTRSDLRGLAVRMFTLAEAQTETERLALEQVRAGIVWAAWHDMKRASRQAALVKLKRQWPHLAAAQPGTPEWKDRGRWLAEEARDLRREWERHMEAAGLHRPEHKPGHVVLRVTPGVGKTEAAIKAIALTLALLPEDMPFRVIWLDASHTKAAETVSRLAKHGVLARHLRGRTEDKHGPVLCERAQLAEQVGAAGYNVRETLCQRRDGAVCPFRATCGYFGQADDAPARGVLVATHNALKHGLPAGLRFSGFVVVDEDPRGALTPEKIVAHQSDGRAMRALLERSDGDWDSVRPVLKAVLDLLERPRAERDRWREWLLEGSVTHGHVEDAVSTLDGMIRNTVGQPDDEGSIRLGLNWATENGAVRQAMELLRAVALDWQHERPTLQSVYPHWGHQGGEERLTINICPAAPEPPADCVVLGLDGTADESVWQMVLGVKPHVVRIDVPLNAHVTLVTSPSFSKLALGLLDHVSPEDQQRAKNLLTALVRRTDAMVKQQGAGKVGVIVPKNLREAWCPEGMGKTVSEWRGAWLGHFGNQRGLNAMEDCMALVVIGCQQPMRQDMEDAARSWCARDSSPLNGLSSWDAHEHPLDFDKAPRPFQGPHGEWLEREVRTHPDKRVDALLRQTRDAEVWQAVGRIRATRAAGDVVKEIYLMAPVAPPFPVDDIKALDTLLRVESIVGAAHDGQGPLVLDGAAVARAPELGIGRDGEPVGAHEIAKRIRALEPHLVAESTRFRRLAGGRTFPIKKRYSMGKVRGFSVGGTFTNAAQLVLFTAGIPPSIQELERQMGGNMVGYEPDLLAAVEAADVAKGKDAAGVKMVPVWVITALAEVEANHAMAMIEAAEKAEAEAAEARTPAAVQRGKLAMREAVQAAADAAKIARMACTADPEANEDARIVAVLLRVEACEREVAFVEQYDPAGLAQIMEAQTPHVADIKRMLREDIWPGNLRRAAADALDALDPFVAENPDGTVRAVLELPDGRQLQDQAEAAQLFTEVWLECRRRGAMVPDAVARRPFTRLIAQAADAVRIPKPEVACDA